MRERTSLEEQITAIRRLEQELEDAATLIELGEAEGDDGSVREGEEAIRAAHEEAARRQVETLLSGEADGNDTYVEVHSGAGGGDGRRGHPGRPPHQRRVPAPGAGRDLRRARRVPTPPDYYPPPAEAEIPQAEASPEARRAVAARTGGLY